MQEILQKLAQFNVLNCKISDSTIQLQIELIEGENAVEQEAMIKSILHNYVVNIIFVLKKRVRAFKQIIAVCSGKGGVGKSTIALHLAFYAKAMGYKIGILDADIYTPSMPTLLNIFENPMSIDGRLIEPVKSAHGFELLSMDLFLQANQAQLWSDTVMSCTFNQFLEQGNWQCDYLIIDMPPGVHELYGIIAKLAPNTKFLLITEPTKIAYNDLRKIYITLRSMNLSMSGLVINRALTRCRSCGDKQYFYTEAALPEDANELPTIRLPIFHHFHELAEKGYGLDYVLMEELEYFKRIFEFCK